MLKQAIDLLRKHWGYTSFREKQEDVIKSILEKKKTLALLPTGAGKSICYQIPSLLLNGVVLVVSPLISLIKDQLNQLEEKGIPSACITSEQNPSEIETVLLKAKRNEIKLLYVSPERLLSVIFIQNIKGVSLSFMAIDEAHCISQWGNDFRPAYLSISKFLVHFPKLNILALTATATPQTIKDIQESIDSNASWNVIRSSFARKNIFFGITEAQNKPSVLEKLLKKKNNSSAIVYVRSRKNAENLSQFLNNQNLSSDFYHAKRSPEEKIETEKRWQKGEISTIVATSAFGLGIHKPDVRLVLHYDIPDDLESYYQEAGRAGRDGLPSHAILLFNNFDKTQKQIQFKYNHPNIAEYKRIVRAFMSYLGITHNSKEVFLFNLKRFTEHYKFIDKHVIAVISFLEKMQILELVNYKPVSYVKVLISPKEMHSQPILENEFAQALFEVILRSYGGISKQYTAIDEDVLANRLKCKEDKITKHLKQWYSYGIISYEPAKGNTIRMLIERKDSFWIDRLSTIYGKQIKKKWQKLRYMLEYTGYLTDCRQQYILTYFGEKSLACNHCDVCSFKHAHKKNDKEIKTEILKLISESKTKSTFDLFEAFPEVDSQEIVLHLRLLLDEKKIKRSLIPLHYSLYDK